MIAGSTRMKAGTAQKIVLNLFSTAVMVKMGRVYRGLMVDMRARNAKLRRRADGHRQRNRPLSGRRRGAPSRTGRRRREDRRSDRPRAELAAKPRSCCSATRGNLRAAIDESKGERWLNRMPQARWRARPPKSRRRPSAFWRAPICSPRSPGGSSRRKPRIVVFCGRGSSGHVGVYLRYLFEARLGLLVSAAAPSVVTAYRRPPDMRDALFVVVSQSGRSPDLVTATQVARKSGALTLAIVNDENSPAAAASELVLPIGAGRRTLGRRDQDRGAVDDRRARGSWRRWRATTIWTRACTICRARLSGALACDWSAWADSAARRRAAFVVGRGYGLGCVREIALKVAEILRVPALGYSAAELRHGPRASITPATPVLVLRQNDEAAAADRRPRPRPARHGRDGVCRRRRGGDAALDRRRSPGLRSGRHAHPGLSRHRGGGAPARLRSRQSAAPEQGDAHLVTPINRSAPTMPPSTTISVPVTKRASSEARNSAALAVSRPSPMKPSGMRVDARLQQRLDVAAGALLGEPHLDHRRVHLPRHHRVHADALVGVLHGDDARELDHAGLGRGVADLRRAGPAHARRSTRG